MGARRGRQEGSRGGGQATPALLVLAVFIVVQQRHDTNLVGVLSAVGSHSFGSASGSDGRVSSSERSLARLNYSTANHGGLGSNSLSSSRRVGRGWSGRLGERKFDRERGSQLDRALDDDRSTERVHPVDQADESRAAPGIGAADTVVPDADA